MNDTRTKKEIKADFLNQLALLILAESPLKDQIQKFADSQRGKLIAQISPERRHLYLGARDVILNLGDQLIKADDLDQVVKALKVIQGITEGMVWEIERPNDEAAIKRVKDMMYEECHLMLDNVTSSKLINAVHGINPV